MAAINGPPIPLLSRFRKPNKAGLGGLTLPGPRGPRDQQPGSAGRGLPATLRRGPRSRAAPAPQPRAARLFVPDQLLFDRVDRE